MPCLSWQNSGIVPEIKTGLSNKRAKVDSDSIEPRCVRVAVTHEDSALNHDPGSLADSSCRSCRSVTSTPRAALVAAAHDRAGRRRRQVMPVSPPHHTIRSAMSASTGAFGRVKFRQLNSTERSHAGTFWPARSAFAVAALNRSPIAASNTRPTARRTGCKSYRRRAVVTAQSEYSLIAEGGSRRPAQQTVGFVDRVHRRCHSGRPPSVPERGHRIAAAR